MNALKSGKAPIVRVPAQSILLRPKVPRIPLKRPTLHYCCAVLQL